MVSISQGRHADALTSIEDIVDHSEFQLRALRAKVWLEIATKKHSAALADMQKLSQLIVNNPNDTTDIFSHKESIENVGRLYGFLGGPLARSIDQKMLAQQERLVVANFNSEEREAFEQGRNGVLGRFAQLKQKESETRGSARKQAAKETQQKTRDMEYKKTAIEEGKNSIANSAAKIEHDTHSEVIKLQPEYAKLAQAKSQLDLQALPYLTSRAAIEAAIFRLESVDPTKYRNDQAADRARLREIYELQFQLMLTDRKLSYINQQARVLGAHQMAIDSRRQAVLVCQQLEGERLAEKNFALEKDSERLRRMEKQLPKKQPKAQPQLRSLTQQLTSLKTYVEFPIEQEKKRLVMSFE